MLNTTTWLHFVCLQTSWGQGRSKAVRLWVIHLSWKRPADITFVSHEQLVKRNKRKGKKVECLLVSRLHSWFALTRRRLHKEAAIPTWPETTNLLSRKVLILKLWEDTRWSQWDFCQMMLHKAVIKRFWVEIRICQFIHTCKIIFFHHSLINFGAKSHLIYLQKQNMSWISVPHPLNAEVNT